MARIIGTNGNDSLLGTARNDLIFGLDGNDRIDAGAGNDLIFCGAGSDTVYDGAGSDFVDLGAGGGTIFADTTDARGFDIYLSDAASSDVSNVLYSTATKAISVNLRTGIATGAEIGTDLLVNIGGVFGGAGNDTFLGDDRAVNGFSGGAGNDSMKGFGGFDRLDGGDGNDTIDGGDGDDFLTGNGGADAIFGGAGDDRINFTTGPFESGPDTIDGGDGNDFIAGSTGGDILSGGNGNDTIFGGAGADMLSGGTGADKFILPAFSSSIQRDVITDFENGIDKLSVPYGAATFIALAHDTAEGLVVDFGLGPVLLMKNFTTAQLDLGDFF